MQVQKPTTITTPDGQEMTKNSQAQGSILNDGTTDRVVMGFQKDGFGTGQDYGFKVSQAGFDVKTATSEQLIMSSGFNMFKIVATGKETLPLVGSPGLFGVSIDTGIAATETLAFTAYIEYEGGSMIQLPQYGVDVTTTGIITSAVLAFGYVAGSNMYLTFSVTNNSGGDLGQRSIRWYVFSETAI